MLKSDKSPRRAAGESRVTRVKKRAADFLFCTAAGSLYCYALAIHIFASTVLEMADSRLLLLSAVSVAFFYFAFFNRRVSIAFGSLFIAGGAYAFLAYVYSWPGSDRIIAARAELTKLALFFLGTGAERPEYSMLFGTMLSAGLGLFVMLNLRARFGFYLLVLFAAEIIAVPLHMGWGGSEKGVLLMAFCLFILLVKKLNLSSLTEKNAPGMTNSIFALAALPVCVAVFAGAYFLPKPDITLEPLPSREEISRATSDIGNIISSFAPPETSSFSSGGRLGGPIKLGDKLVLEAEASEPLYLAGSVMDIYTGSSWTASAEGKKASGMNENGLDSPYPEDLAKAQGYYMRYYGRQPGKLSVTVRSLRTRSIFTPPFYSGIETGFNALLRMDSFGMVTSGTTLKDGDTYSQEYISWDYSNQYFINILRELAAQNIGGKLSAAEASRYLQLPESLPERVRELSQSLTGSLGNNYDKLKALEKHLALFPYTLSPGNVPAGRDFVDYFLFEEKRGYCVYYASALTVMARCAGIPARHVEGYVMPEESENGIYKITEKQAHAWVEAYFDGFGWVRFEPTAPYFSSLYGEEAIEKPETIPPVTVPPVTVEPETPVETMPTDENVPETEPQNGANDEPPVRGNGAAYPFVVVAVIVIISVAAAALYTIRRKKMAAMQNDAAAAVYFKLALNAAGACGCPIDKSETILAYAKRAAGELGTFGGGIETAARVFSKAKYSLGEITDGEKNIVIECYNRIAEGLKKTPLGKVRYFMLKYILLKI